jgi:hypothetical protein
MFDASNINVRALLIFIEVYEAQNFSVVARRQGISASQISRVIHQLEDALGQQLFYRNTRAVIPTKVVICLSAMPGRWSKTSKRRGVSWMNVRRNHPAQSALMGRYFWAEACCARPGGADRALSAVKH